MLPQLIQGGMGAGVSGWPLAREVAAHGQLGVVSGTALDAILVRRLARGDPGGHVRRAMNAFPLPDVVRRVLKRYSPPGDPPRDGPDRDPTDDAGRDAGARTPPAATDADAGQRYKLVPLPRATLTPAREELLVLANFVEVHLAREGHDGMVGINYLHKIELPILPSLYGAMLAGVDVVLVGAGIPVEIPAILDRLSEHLDVSAALDVMDAGDEKVRMTFDPAPLWAGACAADRPALRRPHFLPIVSSATLARALLKKASGGIDGFVVEKPVAGGHNAPPRGAQQLSHRGEPIYGRRDEVDPADMVALNVPFWLAGGYATRSQFKAALDAGASGVQVGTAFAFCEESGLDPELRRRFLSRLLRDGDEVFTDPIASPTGFPFKVAEIEQTLSDQAVYEQRPRLCDMGYLRRAYRKPDGTIGYRCPAEPVDDYVRKGGKAEDTVGRKCLCNALMANIGLGQRRADGYEEPPLLTTGDDLACVRAFISVDRPSYHARDVIESLLPSVDAAPRPAAQA